MIHIVCSSLSAPSLHRYFLNNMSDEVVYFYLFDREKSKSSISPDLVLPLNSIDTGTSPESAILSRWENSDILISFDCFHIFSSEFLEKIDYRAANFHPSPLPSYGGINPINWGLINDETSWGITWHYISIGIDKGAIIKQEVFDLPTGITQVQLLQACLMYGLRAIYDVCTSLYNGFGIKGNEDERTRPITYYSSNEIPEIVIKNIRDVSYYSRIVPNTPHIDWRWELDLEGKKVTAVSLSPHFGEVHLTKCLELNGTKVYYGD